MYLSITLSFSEKWAYSHLSYTMLSRKILGRMSCPLCRFDDDYRRYESKKDYDSVWSCWRYRGLGSEDVKMWKSSEQGALN